MGSRAKKRKIAANGKKISSVPYRQRPLAPAPKLVFAGVCLVSTGLLVGASNLANDWVAAFGCFAVLALSWAIFDFTGRQEAQRHPNKLYRPDRLPQGKNNRAKYTMIALTFFVLVVVVGFSVKPGHHASALPYFLSIGFLVIVIPQGLAWRVLAEADRGNKSENKSHKKSNRRVRSR